MQWFLTWNYLAEITVALKEANCDLVMNIDYAQEFKNTIKPHFCSCQRKECSINMLVTNYKAILGNFEKYYRFRMAYTMLL